MNCLQCNALLPPLAIACVRCTLEKNYRGSLEQQLFYLPAAKNRTLNLQIIKKADHVHIALFGNPRQAYCGFNLAHAIDRFKKSIMDPPPADICPSCLTVYAHLMDLAHRLPDLEPLELLGGQL